MTGTAGGSRGALARRRRVVLTVAAASAATLMLGACSAKSSSSTSPKRPTHAGGTLVWGKSLDIQLMDPAASSNASDWEFLQVVYDRLVGLDDKGNPVPDLATSWQETSPTTYVFTIRPGVKFSNGRAMTVDDVAGTLNRIENPKTASYWAAHLGIKNAVPVGSNQVKVTLNAPRTALIAALASPMASILPMKELNAATFDPTKQMLGTGPLMVKAHTKDQSWTLVRNPSYWGKPASPSEVDIKILPDDAARIAALRTGTIDVAAFDTPDSAKLLKSQSNISTTVQEANSYYRLDVNAKSSLFSDSRLRQALALSIDRSQIAQVAFGGVGQPTAAIVPAFKVCPADSVPFGKTNVNQARQLVAAAGDTGKTITIQATSGYKTFAPIAQVLQQNLERAGLKVKIEQLDTGVWVDKVFGAKPSFDISVSFSDNYADPSMVLNDYNPIAAVFNAKYMLVDPTLNDYVAQANAEAPGAARDAVQKQACDRIASNANMIPLITKPFIIAYRTDKIVADVASLDPYTVPLANVATFALR